MATLQEKLSTCRREYQPSRNWKCFYIPSLVKEVLSQNEIAEHISRFSTLSENPRDVQRFSTLIAETSLSIFAILLLDSKEHHILDFLYRRETDTRLTYTVDGLYFLPPLVAKAFVDRQWEVCPVILRAGEIHRELKPREILPFLEDEFVAEGGFGVVSRVRMPHTCQLLLPIHGVQSAVCEDHSHEPMDAQDVLIARKELREKRYATKERDILDLLDTLHHPNIIQFLGSYTQCIVENLLFPYVPTNLTMLLESKRQINPHDVYLGMHGIASGLSKIHEFSFTDGTTEFSRIGCHHDFRPSNILVQGKTFLIADFGLSTLRPDDKDSKSSLKGGHDDYLGPESFDPIKYENGTVGRALDIWSFGCMLSEVATFIEDGSVQDFSDKREATYGTDIIITDRAFHLRRKLRPAVDQWLAHLKSHPVDQSITDLVDLILEMLNPNPFKRVKIAVVTQRLAFICMNSQIQAINSLFESISLPIEADHSDIAVQMFLEHKRFESWAYIFHDLHKDDQSRAFSAVSNSLSGLWAALFKIRHRMQTPNDLSQEPLFALKDAQTILDSLSVKLPTIERGRVQDQWIRAVCEVETPKVLLAIRTMGNLDRYRHVGASVAMRYMSRAITASIFQGQRSRCIDSGCVSYDETQPDRPRMMGYMYDMIGRSRVMIEWRVYDSRWQGDQGSKLFTVMDALVNLLDPDVTLIEGAAKRRILPCRGYFHKSSQYRFGFVYSLQPGTGADAQMFSLNEIISMTDPHHPDLEGSQRPNLGDIFILAKELAQCLYTFHNTGWYHKNITSHHLLVFSPSRQLVHVHVVSAILAGFNDSRPEASGFTLGPRTDFIHYQHPLYQQGTDFRRSFDYYALGILLLELGLWVLVPVLKSDHDEIRSSEQFRRKLLDTYVPQLGELMGTVYRDAVEFCLNVEAVLQREEESGSNEVDARALFASMVIEPLSRCFA